MSAAPSAPDATPPALNTDMSAAKSVASTPSGHTFAANTSTGRKLTSPNTVSTTVSPRLKNWSLMPSSRLYPLTRMSCVRPSAVPKTADHRNIFLSGTRLRVVLYSPTPKSAAAERASATLPRNSGVNPSSLVVK